MPHLTSHRKLARQLQRAACAGLPLQVFSEVLFDLTQRAIPNCDIKVLLLGTEGHTKGITKNLDTLKWGPRYRDILQLPAATTRFPVMSALIAGGRNVLEHEERTLPGFYDGLAYDEFFRHLDMHHVLSSMLWFEGQLVGIYPIWRPARSPAFSATDKAFLQRVVPWVAYGVACGSAREQDRGPSDACDSWVDNPGEERGFLVLNARSEVTAMNRQAQILFMRQAEYTPEADPAFFDQWCDMRQALRQVSAAVARVFDSDTSQGPLPVSVLRHPSGLCLRLSGSRLAGSGPDAVTVVEVAEVRPRFLQLQKLGALYGLSPRECQVIGCLSAGESGATVAQRLKLAPSTIYTLVERILAKTECVSIATLLHAGTTNRSQPTGPNSSLASG